VNKRILPVILVLAAALRVEASRGFPSEDRLRAEVRRGMTVGEVIALYGQPDGHVAVNGSFLYRYVAPSGYLTAEREGYIGFELHFVEGKVNGLRTFQGYPSYAPIRPPREFSWIFAFWGFVALAASILAYVVRKQRFKEEAQALLDAYCRKRLQTRRLPEFRFITHETTLQEVIDKLGEPSRRRDLFFDMLVGPEKAAAYGVSDLSTGVADYDLPYGAAAIVMPESPCQQGDKIRAVYYRSPTMDEEY
jgi:hypothetical protein